MRKQTSVRGPRRAVVTAVTGAVAIGVVAIGIVPIGPAGAGPAAVEAPAGGPPTAPAALPELPVSSTYARQVIVSLFPDLGEPTAEQITTVGTALDAGTSAPSVVAQALRQPEWVDARLADDFDRYLDRAPDPSGADFWSRRLRSGASLEQVALALGTSTEAWRLAGRTNSGFVTYGYQAVLSRTPDPSGRAFWTSRLDQGTSRGAFLRSLLRSNQRAARLVDDAYVSYLGRASDPGGRASWVDRYRTARTDELSVIASLLGSGEARRSGCDPLDPRLCLLPFPNDHFTVADATTGTGRRVAMKREWMPQNAQGVAANPQELNRNDGFGVGQSAVVKVPGIDLEHTGATSITDIGASVEADAPIVVIDADTGERHPTWVELDANIAEADRAADQLLYVRPAVNYQAGHRYIVALRDLRDAAGALIEAPAGFVAFRDGEPGDSVGAVEQRRSHLESVFADLDVAGIDRDDLYLAWDFTVASTENTTGRMLHIRDDALASLDGDAPAFTVTSVTPNPRDGVAKRVDGTFEVPLYLTGDGAPGNAFNDGPDGLPVRNGSFTASFGCELPTLEPDQQARSVVYGHGLFGSYREVRSGAQAAMVRDHDMAYCATSWIGMSEDDIGNALTILQDVSTFRTLPDRSQQGILNTILLGRLMITPDGFVSHPEFQHDGGGPLLDTSDLFYDGNSQGAVIGGAFVATSPDVSAGVLGVAGMNYSMLLERSVDFDPFSAVMRVTYPSAVDRVLGLQLLQMLWDRGETNGYAAHLTDDPLPGTNAARVLLHTALGDHQVATVTAEIEARTAGMAIHRPVYLPGRSTDVDDSWNLPALDYPSSGSALVVWDSGAALSPLENVPPREGEDPHQDPRNSVDAQQQKSTFLQTGGTIVNVCGDAPCTAPAT